MYDYNRGYEDESYNTKEQRIRQLCEEYYHFKRKPKGWRITNYYMYYGIPKPPVNRSGNLSKYYLETNFIEPDPFLYYYVEDYYEHQKVFTGIRRKIEENIAKIYREREQKENKLLKSQRKSADYF